MSIYGVNRKTIVVKIPEATYEQIKKLAQETGRTVPGYIRYLIHRELKSKGLPIYIHL